jgi:hypothetical protein
VPVRHGWRNGGFGGLPKHIRIATRQAASGADAVLAITTALAAYHGQLRCPANSAAFRSGVASRSAVASSRCVRPARYRLPGQVPFWPATFCAGVRVAISLGMLGSAGLWPVSLASGVSVFCSPNMVRKTSATSAGCPPVSRRRLPDFPARGADVRGFRIRWPGAMSAFHRVVR